MSLTLTVWLILFAGLTYMALFRKAVWGFAVYALSFFFVPAFLVVGKRPYWDAEVEFFWWNYIVFGNHDRNVYAAKTK